MSSIVVVGSVNVDMVIQSRKLPSPGETVTGGTFVLAQGGKGANQAVAANNLVGGVGLVAKVGKDMFGDQTVRNFAQGGMNVDCVLRDPDKATGTALILVDAKGENLISVAPGANFALTPDDIDQAAAMIAGAKVLLLQLEIPMETVTRAAEVASEAGVTVILDPAPAAPLDRGLLEKVDFITPNETEATQITGIQVIDPESTRAAAKKLLDMGAKQAVITLGSQGVYWTDGDEELFVPARKVEACDTTAAGDAFNGAFGAALVEGLPIDRALSRACNVASLSATKMGAQPSLPTLEEVEEFERRVFG